MEQATVAGAKTSAVSAASGVGSVAREVRGARPLSKLSERARAGDRGGARTSAVSTLLGRRLRGKRVLEQER